jgi:pimeloyl-ACP methyl ester carboxylesterase
MSLPQTSLIWESSAPSVDDFDYSFERLASVTEEFTEKLNLSSYALYLSDIGASVGIRLAVMHPERVTALIIQNGEAHAEALNKEFLTGLVDYWKDRSERNAQVLLDWLLTIEGTSGTIFMASAIRRGSALTIG